MTTSETTAPKITYRRIPGYYNHHTYRVEIDGRYVMDVRQTGSATWSRSATWSAIHRGTNWSHHTPEVARDAFICNGDTRAEAVKNALRKMENAR